VEALKNLNGVALAAWSIDIVFACRVKDREIESRQDKVF
jgi:predicted metal-dependent HD superfamily phosphohydrolase